MRFQPSIPSQLPPLASALTLLLHALSPAGVTTPSDSWPMIEASLHSLSASSFPSIPLWPLTQAAQVSFWLRVLLQGSFKIRASILDRGGEAPVSSFFMVVMCGRGVRTVIVEYTELLLSEQRVDISDSLEVELKLIGDLNRVRAGLGVDVALGTFGIT